ncbi:porin family protein [Desertivirga arenae]|uniref:porin family protein n=1 Tax=Desertivirga arenae TaxID=2810309 RepID=UPI001A96D54D|nr:porin family protein [Pedobacter sp. SYSU D00823]
MKKLFFTAMMLVAGSSLFAQTKFGLKAGVNFANMTQKDDGSNVSTSASSRLTYNLTGYLEIPLSESIFFQPGLSLMGKGYKAEASEELFDITVKGEEKTDLMYLEVPLNAVKKFDVGTGKFFVGAGPYIAYGLSGKYKISMTGPDEDGKTITESDEGDINFGTGDDDDVKPLDMGLNFLAGYQLGNGISLNGSYGLGLTNLAQKDSGSTLKNKVFSISLGFLF